MSRPASQMRRSMNAGGENPEFIIRDFTHGVHNFAAREAINDEEFWWCENVMPLAPGNLANVPKTSAALATSVSEGGTIPFYSMGFNINGTPYLFAAFPSGNAYVVNLNSNIVTQIMAGLLLPEPMYATQYGNSGILIIHPLGYWDWNVTTPGVLTAWNNSITGGTITTKNSVAGHTALTQSGLTGGTGGSVQAIYSVISVALNAGGTGYVVGDSITLTDGLPVNPTFLPADTYNVNFATNVVVTSIGAGGAITGISVVVFGTYAGPQTGGGPFNTGPGGTAISGGTGTGATFNITVQASSVLTVAPGSGYSAVSVTDKTGGGATITVYNISTAGVIGGTAIATYAGRVWIANGRTIYFTEIGRYNYFGGSGSFFTITDAYLYNAITCLFSANNYLYIFAPTSVDALSNVTVVAGVTSFSRINIVQGVGTTAATSVFGYYRGVCFYDPSGFYILSGASPEKISEKITNVVSRNVLALINAQGGVYGGVLSFRGELCACFAFTLADNISQLGVQRQIIAIHFRKRWWFYSTGLPVPNNSVLPVISVVSPVTNLSTLYTVADVPGGTSWAVYQPLGGGTFASWQVKTKFWDARAPFHIKQAINGAIGAIFTGNAPSGLTVLVDTETGSSGVTNFPVKGNPNAYQLIVNQVNQGGGQYIGLTFNGDGTDTNQINLLALRGKQEGNLLE